MVGTGRETEEEVEGRGRAGTGRAGTRREGTGREGTGRDMYIYMYIAINIAIYSHIYIYIYSHLSGREACQHVRPFLALNTSDDL